MRTPWRLRAEGSGSSPPRRRRSGTSLRASSPPGPARASGLRSRRSNASIIGSLARRGTSRAAPPRGRPSAPCAASGTSSRAGAGPCATPPPRHCGTWGWRTRARPRVLLLEERLLRAVDLGAGQRVVGPDTLVRLVHDDGVLQRPRPDLVAEESGIDLGATVFRTGGSGLPRFPLTSSWRQAGRRCSRLRRRLGLLGRLRLHHAGEGRPDRDKRARKARDRALDEDQVLGLVDREDFEDLVVQRAEPNARAIFLPLKRDPGPSAFRSSRDGGGSMWPCEAGRPWKPWRFITPVVPRPFVTPMTSTRSPFLNVVQVIDFAGLLRWARLEAPFAQESDAARPTPSCSARGAAW